tara:strand:- start:5575 stop:5961 length:387 start_codon:yes stop_codon:yes gene_type:complete
MLSSERFINSAKVLVLLLIILWLLFRNNGEDYVQKYQAQIEALNTKIDSLHSINDDLTYKIDTLNTQILSLDKEINNQDKLIKNLRIKTNEKVRAVDNFNDDELYQFFTERYRHVIDSLRKTGGQTGG